MQCPALTPPVDGSVDVIGPQPVGTVATYMCDFGLVDGKVNRYCLADGTWSGIDPTCASGEAVLVNLKGKLKNGLNNVSY